MKLAVFYIWRWQGHESMKPDVVGGVTSPGTGPLLRMMRSLSHGCCCVPLPGPPFLLRYGFTCELFSRVARILETPNPK